MRVSHLFGETLREAPTDTDLASQQLLLRAGFVRQLAAGIYSTLPLAQRSLRRIEQIIREEIDAIGGQELSMPVVHPAELWQQTGRYQAIDATMARFEDRRGRPMLLAMTHEEVVASLSATEVRSYRQLPQLVYQIQTKFRDEPRPRAGLIRTREFVMKDSYSLDRDEDGLRQQYQAHYDAYFRIFKRAGLPVIAVGSDVGMMGGKVAHEYMYLTPGGEDTLVVCRACDYAANQEVARFRKESYPAEPLPIERISTPDTTTIATLAALLGIQTHETAKAVFWMAEFVGSAPKLVIAIVRGDHEANQTAVLNLIGARALRAAELADIQAAGAVAGYGSPIGVNRERTIVVIDEAVRDTPNLVAGANEPGYHLRNTNAGRDYDPDIVGNIAQATAGAPCPECGQPLTIERGVEVGNIFQLGTRYSAALGATYTAEDGTEQPIVMGSYGIGVGRLLACVAEHYHDDRGLMWPIAVAPYAVALVGLGRGDEIRAQAETLYDSLVAAGIEVLYDDRDVSPGIKFADADLRGMPIRVTIGEKSLRAGGVELKPRTSSDSRIVAMEAIVAALQDEITALRENERPTTNDA